MTTDRTTANKQLVEAFIQELFTKVGLMRQLGLAPG
jgi:hypothetical protein